MAHNCTLSVVVPTHNSGGSIHACLRSLELQSLPREQFEIIVVDDGSTDDTMRVLRAFSQTTTTTFRYITQPNSGPACARNSGVSASAGLIVCFTDDDCIVDHCWLESIALHFDRNPDTSGIAGLVLPAPGTSLLDRFAHYHNWVGLQPVLESTRVVYRESCALSPDSPIAYTRTCNAALRKADLIDAGGFDETFRVPGGEDPDLGYRMLDRGASLRFERNAVVWHCPSISVASLRRTFAAYSRGSVLIARKKHLYRNRAVRSNYTWLLLRRMSAVAAAGMMLVPRGLLLFTAGKHPWIDCIAFPFLLVYLRMVSLLTCLVYKSKGSAICIHGQG